MPNRNNTRKVRKCSLVGKTLKNNKGGLQTINNCKQMYNVDDSYSSNRLTVRKISNQKVILDIPTPTQMLYNSPGVRRDPNNSVMFNYPGDSEWTYVGHQVFSFSPLKDDKFSFSTDLIAPVTISGIVRPYAITDKYVYFLREKVVVPKKLLDLSKDVHLQLKNMKTIPFSVKMIDAGVESNSNRKLLEQPFPEYVIGPPDIDEYHKFITEKGKKIYEIHDYNNHTFKKYYTHVYTLKQEGGKYVRDKKILDLDFKTSGRTNASNSVLIRRDRTSNTYYYIGHKAYIFKTINNDHIDYLDYQENVDRSGRIRPYVLGDNYIYFFREAVAVPRHLFANRFFGIPTGKLKQGISALLGKIGVESRRPLNNRFLGVPAGELVEDIYARFATIGAESRIPLKMKILDNGPMGT
jgi:hypothetical protein